MNTGNRHRINWLIAALICCYALLAAGTFFKFSYELGTLFDFHFWAKEVYARMPAWAQLAMGVQAIAFSSILGLSIIQGNTNLLWPAPKRGDNAGNGDRVITEKELKDEKG